MSFHWNWWWIILISGSVSWCMQLTIGSELTSHHAGLWRIWESSDRVTIWIYYKLLSLRQHSFWSMFPIGACKSIVPRLQVSCSFLQFIDDGILLTHVLSRMNIIVPMSLCLLVLTLSSDRVGVWESAKWVARVRDMTCSRCSSAVILKTNMTGGHFGEGGCYSHCEETAYDYALLMKTMNLECGQ